MALQINLGPLSIILLVIAAIYMFFQRFNILDFFSNVNARRKRRRYDNDDLDLRRDSRQHFASSRNKRQRHRESSSVDEETAPPTYSSTSADHANECQNAVLKQRLAADRDIVDLILSDKVKTSRYIKKDISEMMTIRKGATPNQLKIILEGVIKHYKPDSQQYRTLEAIINELNAAQKGNPSTGKCHMEQVAATSTSCELTATFVAYQYRYEEGNEPNTRLLVVDAIIISNTQKLSVEWARIAGEISMLGVLGFLINPALGLGELVAAIPAILLGDKIQLELKASTCDTHAKALLFKMLIDRGVARIEDKRLYLAIE